MHQINFSAFKRRRNLYKATAFANAPTAPKARAEQAIKAISIATSCCALLISFAAYRLSEKQLETQRIHNQLTIHPNLKIYTYVEPHNNKIGIFVENVGLGPAILKNIYVITPNKRVLMQPSLKWNDPLENLKLDPNCFKRAQLKTDYVIRPGENYPILAMGTANSPMCMSNAISFVKDAPIEIRIEYESAYRERLFTQSKIEVEDRQPLVQLQGTLDQLRKLQDEIDRLQDEIKESQNQLFKTPPASKQGLN